MENVISERKGRAPHQVYDVQVRDAAPLRFNSAAQAAERFAALDAADRPIVIRTTRAEGVEHSTTVARTVTGPPGQAPQKEVARGVDRDFVREYNKAVERADSRSLPSEPALAASPAPGGPAAEPLRATERKKLENAGPNVRVAEDVPLALEAHFNKRGRHYHFKENPEVVGFSRTGPFRGGR
jgi:hypothetical protein